MSLFSSSKRINVAINGFGRIGRATFKVLLQNPRINVVALNDLGDVQTLTHLLRYDSAYGKYQHAVTTTKDAFVINKQTYPVLAVREPKNLPWKKLGVDVVLECTGIFRDKEGVSGHLQAGARKVIISAPCKGGGVKTIVRGVNEADITKKDDIISMASCTTNALAPVTAVIEQVFGIKKAIMTTAHAYTADQNLIDGPHNDPRRARAAAVNIIPTTTGAAIATTEAIPSLKGKFDGMALRVPVICGSIVDAVYVLKKKASERAINDALRQASGSKKLKGILAVSNEPLVSTDVIGNPASAIVDMQLTKVIDGDLAKVVAWYDNEWGYSNRLAEITEYFGK
jgi:glyceraldehyde 3-phosphate dehydrogenase